jgi:hypothetical protein
MEFQMSDFDVLQYLLSYAPLERFYLFAPLGNDGVMIKYFDSSGGPWNLMEDDDDMAERTITFLKKSGVRLFHDHALLLAYEKTKHKQMSHKPA